MKTITPSTLHEALEKPLRGEFMKFSDNAFYCDSKQTDNEGTKAHALAAALIRRELNIYNPCDAEIINNKDYQISMTVWNYVTNICNIYKNIRTNAKLIEIEWATYNLSSIHPNLKGICDCYIFDICSGVLYVFDLKTGSEEKTPVEDNVQLICYSDLIINFLIRNGYEVNTIYNFINTKEVVYKYEEIQEKIQEIKKEVDFITNKPIETTLLKAVQELMITDDKVTRARIISDLTRDLITTKASIKEEITARIKDGEETEGFQIITTEPNGLDENNEKSFLLIKEYYDDSEFKRKLPTIKEMRERGVPESIIKQMPRKEGTDKLYRIKGKEKWEI